MKETKDHKDNTGMIIAAVIAILLVLGLVIYFFTNGKDDVKDAIDDTGDTIENITDNDNDTKTAADVAGSYQAKIGNTAGIDEDTAADEDDYIELVLSEDGTAKLVITTDTKDVITSSYTISNDKIRLTKNDETTTDETETNDTVKTDKDRQTYEFKINDDDTLTYVHGGSNVTLAKVTDTNLKYIK